ncbi:MAG: DUF1906 domain-containing protein, partial [Nocardioides sp.]|nr:DUF1906 domain-containing protein [Nocardioides sp.]
APAPTAAQESAQNGAAQGTQKRAANVVTPGDFTGYGFDQCHAPNQKQMNTWLRTSPFLSVGIYIDGDSRACRDQPNLTPAWIATQLRNGWRLLPITLGPQASCQPRFPRYDDDVKINPKPGKVKRYALAKQQGMNEAAKTVEVATSLGIAPKSTLWYDLEGFDSSNTNCRESALTFLSGWTQKLHALGYVSGVYSSAGSGIAALDAARVNRPGRFTLPDMIWVARWDGVANTSTSYLREDGWRPGGRIKQYQGGHDETWGGVRINIDRNFLDVGRGSVAEPETHCGGVNVSFWRYPVLKAPSGDYRPSKPHVRALQCLLKERGHYGGNNGGNYNPKLVKAMNTWQSERGLKVGTSWYVKHWMSLLVAGNRRVIKFGSAGPTVRRVQRTLNAAALGKPVRPNGVFDAATNAAVRAWQSKVGLTVSGVIATESWTKLAAGAR